MSTHDRADEVIASWRAEMPEVAGIPLELARRAARLSALLDAAAMNELTQLGLTRGEYEILATLRRVGAPYRMKPTTLTHTLTLSSGGTSNLLKRMSDAGYVVRDTDPDDGRSAWVTLTEAGVEIAEAAVVAAVAAQSALLDAVPKRTRNALAGLLRDALIALGDGVPEYQPPTPARAHAGAAEHAAEQLSAG